MKRMDLTEAEPFGYKDFFTEGLRKHRDCFRISPAHSAGLRR